LLKGRARVRVRVRVRVKVISMELYGCVDLDVRVEGECVLEGSSRSYA
jgi:hypothetical protein